MLDAKNKLSEAAAEMGRLGGLARAKSMTAEERSAQARKAVVERWRKYRKRKKSER